MNRLPNGNAGLRRLLAGLLLVLGTVWGVAVAGAVDAVDPIRVGLTPTIPNDQYPVLEEWRRYLERKLGQPVEFVWRNSYFETMDLLRQRKLDYAWICDYPFVFFREQVRLLAVPLYKGRPYYRSYLIVPSSDTQTTAITQLKGKLFAYTDPYSNTGNLSPRYLLVQQGEDPSRFFRRTFYTFSHRKVVEAVAGGVAQGGAVSSHVWDTLSIANPELTRAARIVSVSPEYGFPPLVARSSVSEAGFRAMQRHLLEMAADEEGRTLLRRLNIDGFIEGDPRLYEPVEQMMRVMNER